MPKHGIAAVAWNDEIELCADSLYLELTGKAAEEVFQGLGGPSRPAASRDTVKNRASALTI